jgi:hypothetical protein
MKLRFLAMALVVLSSIGFISPNLMAGAIDVGNWVFIEDWNPNNDGGIIQLYVNTTDLGYLEVHGNKPDYFTFCADQRVAIASGVWVEVLGISGRVNYQADWLFSNWISGGITLGGLDDQQLFQEALWYYLGTLKNSLPYDPLDPSINPYITDALNVADMDYGTRMLNLGEDQQPQLYHVPEPSSLILLCSGLFGVIGFGRLRFSQR